MKINFSQLLNLGISPAQLQKLTEYLLPQINQDLYLQIKKSLSFEDYKALEKSFKNVSDDQKRVKILEILYQKNTGKSFVETGYQILQEYLDLTAQILQETKKSLVEINNASKKTKGGVKKALEKEDFKEVKKILDKLKI